MTARPTSIARALAQMQETDPALSALALWCHVVDSDTPTRTSAATIHIGPEFTALPLREQVSLAGHHILHIAFRHEARMAAMATRMGCGFDQVRYNLAADALVNEILEQAGHALPRPAATLSSLLRDVLHEDLQDALTKWDVDRLYTALSAQSGEEKDRQDDYLSKMEFRNDLDPKTGQDRSSDAAEWQAHLTRAAQSTGASGRGIGSLLSRLADRPVTHTAWEKLLRRLLAYAVSHHPRRSHRRPRRSWIAAEADTRARDAPTPVFEPGQSRDVMRPRIVVGIDSSGSVSDATLALFSAEVLGIARRSGAETHALYFDETVYRHDILDTTSWDLHRGDVRREGGTSFAGVIEQAAALSPSIIVILTDLDGPFGLDPACRVVWATPLDQWADPPFGTVLSLAR